MIEGHVLIVGTTECGKSTLAKILCAEYGKAGIKRIVLDPLNDPQWRADFQTRDPDEFLRICKTSQSCAIFIDESSQSLNRYDAQMDWLATMSRQWGHRAHFVGQRAKQLNPTIRANCSTVFAFRINHDDARELSNDMTRPEIMDALTLGKGEFIAANRFAPPKRCRIDFARKVIVEDE